MCWFCLGCYYLCNNFMLPKRRFWTAEQPCGKQHFREIATPDWVGQFTNLTYWWVCSHLRKLLTQSCVAISRKCCFPHGWTTRCVQPSATHPHFWQTCLFTIFPMISTTNRGSPFWENREKAGLSKMGMSCRWLVAYAFLNELSISGSPKRVLTPLKSTSKTHTQRFVQTSKIFVWGP